MSTTIFAAANFAIYRQSDRSQEACVCDLIDPVGLSQPTVSHHLKALTTAGFLTRSQWGTWAYYRPASTPAVSYASSGWTRFGRYGSY
ncbi:MAG: helix-turn-helix transcriptional regulator [Actinobacteria bacterium]|nr:helix-turn-helix transcriptional regulator [Actinomycetota bacterium]